mgnify:CR=1 FL=1
MIDLMTNNIIAVANQKSGVAKTAPGNQPRGVLARTNACSSSTSIARAISQASGVGLEGQTAPAGDTIPKR